MKKITSLFLLLLFIVRAYAQGVVSGTVVDADTKQPLEGASVFAQNTSLGTITKKDGRFQLALNKGGYELVISFTGYQSKRMNIAAAEDKNLDIELQKEDKTMSEIVITASNEVADGWEQYGDFFLKHFIGATPFASRCIVQNPEVLKFFYYKRSDKVKVLATAPLLIANQALGYSLHYALDSFVYYNKTGINLYRGNCLYQAMEGDSAQQAQWKEARVKAYYGSRLHFLRSYFDSTLKKEGFTVDILTSPEKFSRIPNPYDTAYYLTDDTAGDVELWFPKKISITYTKKAPEREYLQQMRLPLDVKTQISYVDLTDAILIKPNGYFIDQKAWVNQGYWSWKNLADQLPYDYKPEQ
ncbi:MAG: carboxypeptidase-like regulatory domain-containing protein [Flavisolibacter sp.]|nr:carboxypeptidase-like regulatory domain-containing protein [Flavisolibacter sp.]